ncbi:MAG: DUF456 domain-containing protein [Bacteroidales bacterium]|nr:DUF456 domain-containing protein [Bacteroidales bacterium]
MNTFLLILAFVLAVVGILGSIVPGLPGPPLSWAGLIVMHLTQSISFTMSMLIITCAFAVIITVLDYVIPSISTKKFGGSKAGVWGCNIGLIISIIGLPFGPQGLLGVVFWPFLGAFLGETLNHKPTKEALRAAWGAFMGFLCGTGLKLAYAVVIVAIMLKAVF